MALASPGPLESDQPGPYLSLRLTTQLNGLAHRTATSSVAPANLVMESERAAAHVVGSEVAHHVVDPEDLLDLDPTAAVTLVEALEVLVPRETEQWVLALPQAGALGSLRGPVAFNQAALQTGEAVIGTNAGLALVPHRVGRAVQWRVHAAHRPFPPPTPYEAERALSEAVIRATAALTQLDVAGGRRPGERSDLGISAAYSPRQQATTERALRLLVACDAALLDDGAAITSFEADRRTRELRAVRDAARQALCAAASWLK